MSGDEREKVADAFQRLVSQLRADEMVQFYIAARPVNLSSCWRAAGGGAGLRRARADRERQARDGLAQAQWLLYAAMEESLRLHADEQAAVQVNRYVVVPWVPRQTHRPRGAGVGASGAGCRPPRWSGRLRAHRRAAREHLAHVDSMRSELEAEGMATELLDGEQVLRLLWARFNPTKADRGAAGARRRARGARRARRGRRSRRRARGRAAAARAGRAVKP